MPLSKLIILFFQLHCYSPSTGQWISRPTNTIPSRCHQRPFLNCKEKACLHAQVRTYPPLPFLHTIFPANNFIFSITSLFAIHGPVDILSHRRNCATPLPTPPPQLQREGMTASAGGNFFLFPFSICHFPS